MLTQLVWALSDCLSHPKGKVLHRDLKPANVFIDPKRNDIKIGVCACVCARAIVVVVGGVVVGAVPLTQLQNCCRRLWAGACDGRQDAVCHNERGDSILHVSGQRCLFACFCVLCFHPLTRCNCFDSLCVCGVVWCAPTPTGTCTYT